MNLPADGSGKITFPWADGEHAFFLDIPQLQELQGKCNAGPAKIHRRICEDDWLLEDIAETLRLGLIGAGMAPMEAFARIKRYVYARPLIESVEPAMLVLFAALAGPENETLKKKLDERRKKFATI